ncbi:MAG: four helix bundle protein [Bacteroidetes bacterium]|jgi:four helix bundle protein|nr:four helix bundle protein [Bacteroidota bacterium]
MATIRRFEELEVWKDARKLTTSVYRESRHGAFAQDFGLRDQIQRAAVSVMSNIAEGFASRTTGAFIQFLGYARRSTAEIQSHLYVALDLDYISSEQFDEMYDAADNCSRQLYGFIRYLKTRPDRSGIEEPPAGYDSNPRPPIE